MPTMYCALCARPVEARRHIGMGTAILALLTMGMSLLAIPFYRRRCAICKSPAVSAVPPESGLGGRGPLARLAKLEERLSAVEEQLERASVELDRLGAERDFYRQLLGSGRAHDRPGR
jgi:hypothetical protein